MAASCVGAAL